MRTPPRLYAELKLTIYQLRLKSLSEAEISGTYFIDLDCVVPILYFDFGFAIEEKKNFQKSCTECVIWQEVGKALIKTKTGWHYEYFVKLKIFRSVENFDRCLICPISSPLSWSVWSLLCSRSDLSFEKTVQNVARKCMYIDWRTRQDF